MEKKKFVGYSYGRFQTERGEWRDYCNAFMLEEFTGTESADYHFSGQKAMKYACISPDVFNGIVPGTEVWCYFDSKGKITHMEPVNKA